MAQKDSSEVMWSLVESGDIIVQSEDIIDCIEARGNENQKITDGVSEQE